MEHAATVLTGFVALYTVLMIIEIKLMLKAVRKGPDEILPSLQPQASTHAATPAAGQAQG